MGQLQVHVNAHAFCHARVYVRAYVCGNDNYGDVGHDACHNHGNDGAGDSDGPQRHHDVDESSKVVVRRAVDERVREAKDVGDDGVESVQEWPAFDGGEYAPEQQAKWHDDERDEHERKEREAHKVSQQRRLLFFLIIIFVFLFFSYKLYTFFYLFSNTF